MSTTVPFVALLLIFGLSGCVAPEEPPPPRANRVVVPAAPTASTATRGLEDAPIPNRRMGTPPSSSVIKVQ